MGNQSTLILAVTFYALYRKHLAGAWRLIYAITAVMALYLNFFVLIAQLFAKVPALKALAPTQTEGPFKIAQLVGLLVFGVLGSLLPGELSMNTVGQHPRSPAFTRVTPTNFGTCA